MSLFLLIAFFFLIGKLSAVDEIHMNTSELIRNHGYEVEEHLTAKYIAVYPLTLFRIPYGKDQTKKEGEKKPVVFLQHGLLDSSDSWVINSPQESAAFIFADAGFDVWMGNMRGNKYSGYKDNGGFWWGFSFDEMMKYDLIDMINYVKQKTGVKKIHYVGHSQGTLTMFLLSIRNPDFVANNVKSFFALAPVLNVRNVKGFIPALAKSFYNPFANIYSDIGDREVLGPSMQKIPIVGWLAEKIPWLCGKLEGICEKAVESIMGPSTQWEGSRVPIYTSHIPSGTSLRNLLHWAQAVVADEGKLHEFSNPLDRSFWQKVKSRSPAGPFLPPIISDSPEYDLSKISGDVHVFWSEPDFLATKDDITGQLFRRMKEAGIYKEDQIHELQNYNHVDFLWGKNAATDIYSKILQVMNQDRSV